jgi:ATP-dependent Clp endopeptidase proteolytic subunit ClpP
MYLFLVFILSSCVSGKTIELTNDNFVSLRDSVTSQSINNLIYNLIKLKSDNRYIYLNTNGGSVDAGLKLINTINDLNRKNISVSCIVDTAISMGFVILQSCKERYVLEHATLMQHQMSLQDVKGQIRNLNSYFKFINNLENKLNKIQADRIRLELKDFEEKIHDDWWMDSDEAIKNNVADEIVNINCNFENTEEEVIVNNVFGQIKMIYSKCPQVPNFIKIKNEDENIDIDKLSNLKMPRFIDRLIY